LKKKHTIAFTLIETLAVVTVAGVLAAAILVPMSRRLDALVGKKESEVLKTLAEAYKGFIVTSSPKIVPNHTGWATNLANRLGIPVSTVTNNSRGLQRVFLVDPNLAFGAVRATNLPYFQNLTNSINFTTPPVSPRFMLISSLSMPLPSTLVSGVGNASGPNAFTNIWITPEGQRPAGWTWNGHGDDLKIERFSLENLFLQVILNNRDTNLIPRYVVDEALEVGVPFGGRRSYFVQGTELKLYNAVGILEYSEILTASRSFTFEYGTWQGEAFVGHTVSQTSPLDLQKVMNTFMNAPPNTNVQFGATQLTVSNALVLFLDEYITWRDAGYPGQFQGQGTPPKSLEEAREELAKLANDLLTRGTGTP
jgi:type II secretory pathway pseudopilin PulG